MRIILSLVLCLAFTCISVLTSIKAGEVSRQKYLELTKFYPNLIQTQGDFSNGEIQIVLDSQEIASIEKATGRDVGVIMQDKYWLWVKDACIFPSGQKVYMGESCGLNL